MRRSFIIGLALLVTTVTAFAVQVTLQYFQARSMANGVLVEWKSTAEEQVVSYDVERAGSDQVYRHVATISAKGSQQSYSYTDEEAIGKRDGDPSMARTYFTYRLKINHADRSVAYSNTTGVTHNVSGLRKTWGMIKEMFR